MSVQTLAGALASLRDSLRHVASEADELDVAVRATQARIRTNLLLRRLGAGAGLALPVAAELARRLLVHSAEVSLVNPDDRQAAHLVLDGVERGLGDLELALNSAGGAAA